MCRWWMIVLLCVYLSQTCLADSHRPDPYQQIGYFKAQWGAYTVRADRLSEIKRRVLILDRQGRFVREIRAFEIDDIRFVHLGGNGPPDLCVATHPFSNIVGDRRAYYFSRASGGVRNILMTDDGEGALRHLRGSRWPVIMADRYGPMELMAVPLCHACSPHVMTVIGWNGRRYDLQNRHYPWLVRPDVRKYRKDLLANVGGSGDRYEPRDEILLRDSIGYYANLATVGSGRMARHWLMRHLPRSARQLFLEALPEINARLDNLRKGICSSQQKLIDAPE